MSGLTLTAMISMVLAGYLDSTVLRGFHAELLGVQLGPVDTIFAISGCLTMLAGVFAMIALRHTGDQPLIQQPSAPDSSTGTP